MLAAHPYEEPAFDLVELADPRTSATGAGRIGSVAPTTLGAFADAVAAALPATAHGVRVAGDPDRPCAGWRCAAGPGDFLLDEVLRSDADVYVTSDLRHHPAAEFLEQDGPALVDVAHWAAEWTWLPVVRARLGGGAGRYGGDPGQHAVHRPVDLPQSEQCHPTEEPPLKADPSAQLKLLDVQELDARADQLRHQLASLPELAEIDALEATAPGARRPGPRRPDRGRRPERGAEEDRRGRGAGQGPPHARPDRIDQGLISNPQDIERMQHEMVSLERRITSLEDDELEIMATLEDAQRDPRRADRRRSPRPTSGSVELRARARRRGRRDRGGARRQVGRARARSRGSPRTCWRSTRSCARNRRGVGAAELRQRRCTGCQLTIDFAELAVIKQGPRPTWSSGARSARGSSCAPPSQACDRERIRRRPARHRRGRRRVARQPRPGGVRRGAQGRRRPARCSPRTAAAIGRRQQQRRGVLRADRRAAAGRRARAGRRPSRSGWTPSSSSSRCRDAGRSSTPTCGRWRRRPGALAPAGTTYTWVPREQNGHADRLANEALDGCRSGVTRGRRGARPRTR